MQVCGPVPDDPSLSEWKYGRKIRTRDLRSHGISTLSKGISLVISLPLIDFYNSYLGQISLMNTAIGLITLFLQYHFEQDRLSIKEAYVTSIQTPAQSTLWRFTSHPQGEK